VGDSGRERNLQWFRGGLVFKAHRILYRSTLGSRVIKKKTTHPKVTAATRMEPAAMSVWLKAKRSAGFRIVLWEARCREGRERGGRESD